MKYLNKEKWWKAASNKYNNFYLYLQNFKWSKLRNLHQLKIIQTTYIWLIIVPIVAKILCKINHKFTITFANNMLQIVMDLPFSWYLFYFSAFFFTAGNLLFLWKAPDIIKENKDLVHFLNKKRTNNDLRRYCRDLNISYDDSACTSVEDHFRIIYSKAELYNKKYRIISIIMYSVGLLLISIVFLQNLFFVLKLFIVNLLS